MCSAGYGYYCTTLYNDKIIVYDATTEHCYPVRLFIQDLNNRKLTSTKYVNMIINRNEVRFNNSYSDEILEHAYLTIFFLFNSCAFYLIMVSIVSWI